MHASDIESVSLPTRLNEDWRFGQPHIRAPQLAELIDRARQLDMDGSALPDGVQLEECTADVLPTVGSDALMQRALARLKRGHCLKIADGSHLPQPIVLRSEAHGAQVQYLRVVVGAGTQLHLIEEHAHNENSMLVCLRHYELLPGATLRLEQRENGSGCSHTLCVTSCSCASDTRLCLLSTHSDFTWARHESTLNLTAPRAEALLLSANRLRGKQCLDMRSLQLHSSPECKSRLLCKNVADEQSTAIFGGNIRVQPRSHNTDAYLSNLNLLLSPPATVHSLPTLEILADRVRCSHGAASAPLDAEQLFYLLSRGINLADARAILSEAFLADVRLQFEQF